MSIKSGTLTYLEPLGPVQACCGRPLPFYWKYYEFGNNILKVMVRPLWEVPRCTAVSVYSNGQLCIPEGSNISTVRHKNWSREWASPRPLHGSKLLDLLCNISEVLRSQFQETFRGFVSCLTAIPRLALVAYILPKQTSLRHFIIQLMHTTWKRRVVCFLLGNYQKESIQHTEHGESLKST